MPCEKDNKINVHKLEYLIEYMLQSVFSKKIKLFEKYNDYISKVW